MTAIRGRAEVARLKQRLDATFERAEGVDPGDLQLRADLAKYLCVLIAGFFEKAVQELATDWCRRQSAPTVSRYTSKQLQRLQNIGAQKLKELFDAFGADWRNELETEFDDELVALGSVYSNRNELAHGGNVDLTMTRVRDYYASIRKLVDHLELRFAPQTE